MVAGKDLSVQSGGNQPSKGDGKAFWTQGNSGSRAGAEVTLACRRGQAGRQMGAVGHGQIGT